METWMIITLFVAIIAIVLIAIVAGSYWLLQNPPGMGGTIEAARTPGRLIFDF